MRRLWEWTLTFRVPTSKSGSDYYPNSQHKSEQVIMVMETKLKITQSVGQTIALACDSNPTKVVGSKFLISRLQIMLDEYRKVDPATRKKLPV